MHSAASAQDARTKTAVSPHRILVVAHRPTEPDALYAQAASVAARAGVASPADGPLSREELLSILMLMSLREAAGTHSS
jgi:hypothetical protein